MASHLVGQHQQSTFASPVNGAAGDATVVLGNDNATVTTYNAHDIDPTIHVQDSSAAVLGATPAGTAGRKWMTNDAGAVYLYFDTGSAWVEANYLRNTGGTVAGNVEITGTLAVDGVTTITVSAGQNLVVSKPTGASIAWDQSGTVRAAISGINGSAGLIFYATTGTAEVFRYSASTITVASGVALAAQALSATNGTFTDDTHVVTAKKLAVNATLSTYLIDATGEMQCFSGNIKAWASSGGDFRTFGQTVLGGIGSGLGFYGSAGTTQLTVTGSRGSNAALTSLLSALASLNLIVNSSS